MELTTEIFLTILLILSWITIFFGLPGTVLIFIFGALFAWPYDFDGVKDLHALLILLGLMVLAEGLENLVMYFGARSAKVPKDVTIVAILSGIVGAIVGVPVAVIGSIVGMFVGVFLGTYLYSYLKIRDLRQSWKQAKATLFSRALAIGVKALIGLIMIVYILFHF